MKRQRGATLIELMVALVIGMLVAISVFSIMALSEGRRRATTTVNSLHANGLVAIGQIERWARSVGGGLSPAAGLVYGCTLQARQGTTTVLPLTDKLPEPFDGFGAGSPIRLAPLIIWPDMALPDDDQHSSDMLMVMASGTGGGGLPVAFDAAPEASTIYLKRHSLDFAGGDLVLVAEGQASSTTTPPCAITQVQASFKGSTAKSLPLDGDYAAPLAGFSGDAVAINLGNLTASAGAQGGRPQLLLAGVGRNSTLFSYDLLQGGGANAVAGDVLEMHARYGIGDQGDGKVTQWVRAEGDYSPAKLLDGTAAANRRLRNIKSVRVGIILRTALQDRVEQQKGAPQVANAVITADAPTLFTELGNALSYTRTWGSEQLTAQQEQLFRYRTMEVVIPLRNAVMVDAP